MLRLIFLLLVIYSKPLFAEINKEFIKTLYKPSSVKDVQLSPSGKYAILIYHEDKTDYIDVYNLETRAGANIQVAGSERVKFKEVRWVDNDTALVYWNDNVRDKISVFHLSYVADSIAIASRFTITYGGAVLHHLPNEENKIIFAKRSQETGYENFYKIDLSEEQDERDFFDKKNKLKVNYTNVTDWAFDADNQLRFIESKVDEEFIYYYLPKNSTTWKETGRVPDSELNYFYSIDNEDRLITLVTKDDDRRVIAYYDPNSMQQIAVAHEDANYDITNPILSPGNKLIGFSLIMDGVLQQVYFDDRINNIKDTVKEKKGHKNVYIVGSSIDSNRFLLLGTKNGFHYKYYDYDLQNRTLKFTKDPRPWLKNVNFSTTDTIKVKKQNGTLIEAYLSLPHNIKNNIPLIVNPHGGPFGVRDYKHDKETEILVSQGYAVLRVNFRGSSGFGKNYIDSAKQGLGTIIEEDIYQAVQHTLKNYPIDKDRICSLGISYGGYSTAMLLAKHPDIFKCGVSYAGVFDLSLQINEAKRFSLYKEGLDKYFKDYIADIEAKPELQKQKSPVYHASKIRAPMLILHGTEDPVVDIEQSYRMQYALEKAGVRSELHVFDDFEHGFRDEKDIVMFFEKVIPFLETNL